MGVLLHLYPLQRLVKGRRCIIADHPEIFVDWEYPREETEESYEALVLELAEALHAMDKELSAAVAGATADNSLSSYVRTTSTIACTNLLRLSSLAAMAAKVGANGLFS